MDEHVRQTIHVSLFVLQRLYYAVNLKGRGRHWTVWTYSLWFACHV